MSTARLIDLYQFYLYRLTPMPANPLTPAQLADAARLKSFFSDWQKRRRDNGEPASQEDAASMLSFNQSALSQYLNGKIPLNVEAATKIATLIGCTVDQFSPALAEQVVKYGTALPQDALGKPPHTLVPNAKRVAASDIPNHEITKIKRVNLALQAGIMGFETSQSFDEHGTLNVPTRWVEENGYVPQCLIAITVKGDSMEPMFYAGDIVVVNYADTKLVSGKTYAINFNGEAVVKRLRYQTGDWYLESENPAHKRRMCRGGECIVIGRVVRLEALNCKDRL